ncbi:unnamed protein product [Adineta steineri]|uniref:NHL repeat containing protein-like protein n=1 Tax=Adineta steineri TaxID=433720 RepID=A0A814U8I9_9BILA|nr:unnamed protein product [Adineta steineri]
MTDHHQVVKRSLNNSVMTLDRIAAGTGIEGSALNQLANPGGIFVDVNLDLYVADCLNNRVQLFKPGESNGITVAGSTSLNPTIKLSCPRAIVLDAEKYLFIVDISNNRIVGSGLNGFRCLVGCYGVGSQSNQLNRPYGLSFDHSGNMFVTDQRNSRIQVFLLMKDSFVLSFNQPKFCSTATWNSNGITIANRSIVGQYPTAIFVNMNNTIYIANQQNSTIVMWQEESVNPTKIIHGDFTEPNSLFVTSNGDIYIDDGEKNGRVQRWSPETNIFVTVMNVSSSCFGLFVDINDTLYCSMRDHHQVVKRSLNDSVMASNRVAAGTGINGSASNQLYSPIGIFVDVNLDLYVTDCGNDRVQLLQSGESNGIAVADRYLSLNPPLDCPSGIILDAEKYLFIVDQNNNRIVRSDLNGFRCLVGCYGVDSQVNHLNNPSSFSFDRSKNIFFIDQSNHQIQKFQYIEDSCVNNSSAVQTVYASKLTTNSSTYFLDCWESSNYYEAIQVNVHTGGVYTLFSKSNMNTHGAIYKDCFNPSNPYENQLPYGDDRCNPNQFRFRIALETNITYILLVTTWFANITGAFSIFVSGPNHVDLKNIMNNSSAVQTVYASKLTANSSTYFRSCSDSSSYYEAIQVNVHTDGVYTFFSKSSMITEGYIYEERFNPSYPTKNQLSVKPNNCDSPQFTFIIALETSITYILIVTTWAPNITGAFSIFVSGPNHVDLKNISSPSVIEISYSSTVQSEYKLQLTTNSQTYSRDCRQSNYYYETIRVNVVETGYYAVISYSSIDTFGDIYEDDFNPMNPFENLLSQDYRVCSHDDFKFIVYLHTGTKYILVVTTSSPNTTGKFFIETSGPKNITFDPYSKYFVLFCKSSTEN